MERKKIVKFARLAALLLFAAILAGCTATPDTTIQTNEGDIDDPIFPVRGTPTPEPGQESPTPTTGFVINLPSGSPGIDPSPSPGGWGSIISSNQPFLTPTASIWGGMITVTPTPGAVTPSPTPMVLKLGAKGPAVRDLQRRLKDLKYNIGSVDGDFGKSTEAAVKAFQARNNLYVDGIAGTATLNKLNSSSALPPKPTAKPTPRPTATPVIKADVYLRNGSSGSDVRRMQQRLIDLGYLMGQPNGRFDDMTEAAVYAFQDRNTSYSDGVAGQETLKKLYSSSARSTSSSVGIIGTSIQRGLKDSSAVRRIQAKLKDLGYYTGSVDGDFGASTEAAVKAFQSANNLSPDGRVGSSTYQALFSSKANKAGSTGTNQQGGAPTRIPNYVNVTPNPAGGFVTLREGNSGPLVRKLQQALKDQGYYTGTVDGFFGFGTTQAVKDFQRRKGLVQDGLAGQGTQRILFQGDFPSGS